MNSSASTVTPNTIQNNNKDHKELVTITEKINLTKNQYEVLNIISNTYEESVSQYLQEALVEAMRFDIEEGNFSDVLLQKITDKKEEKSKSSVNKEKVVIHQWTMVWARIYNFRSFSQINCLS